MESTVKSIIKFWPIIVSLIAALGSFMSLKADISLINSNISNIYKYVDQNIKSTNQRIDSLRQFDLGLHDQLVESNNRIDNSLSNISDLSKNTNDRLDKIWFSLYDKKK